MANKNVSGSKVSSDSTDLMAQAAAVFAKLGDRDTSRAVNPAEYADWSEGALGYYEGTERWPMGMLGYLHLQAEKTKENMSYMANSQFVDEHRHGGVLELLLSNLTALQQCHENVKTICEEIRKVKDSDLESGKLL